MFKALNIRDDAEVIIIDPKWQGGIESLRAMDRQDLLVCQGCREPVRVRAGQERRHHFAHKHLLSCSYSDESAALREARAVLYEWLSGKFGEDVSIEKKVDENCLFRPVDCWVEKDNKVFAYWIFDTSLAPEKREQIKNCFNNPNFHVNYVFSSGMLRKDTDRSSGIHLTTTEREFMQRSIYDEGNDFGSPARQSLHYLDTQQRNIITFRALFVIHRPLVYEGSEIISELAQVLVSPKNGEFVHPGEHERLKQYLEEKTALERRRKDAQERRKSLMTSFQKPMDRSPVPPRTSPAVHVTDHVTNHVMDHETALAHPLEKEGVCIFCGVLTTEWWTLDSRTGECKCKSCLRQGMS
jgi:hypothetical protein